MVVIREIGSEPAVCTSFQDLDVVEVVLGSLNNSEFILPANTQVRLVVSSTRRKHTTFTLEPSLPVT